MSLKFFSERAFGRPVAINPDHVIYVKEIPGNITFIQMIDKKDIEVTESYLDVVARLNERN